MRQGIVIRGLITGLHILPILFLPFPSSKPGLHQGLRGRIVFTFLMSFSGLGTEQNSRNGALGENPKYSSLFPFFPLFSISISMR